MNRALPLIFLAAASSFRFAFAHRHSTTNGLFQ
jgi:hypothetical protein